jgi:hypothetical protein
MAVVLTWTYYVSRRRLGRVLVFMRVSGLRGELRRSCEMVETMGQGRRGSCCARSQTSDRGDGAKHERTKHGENVLRPIRVGKRSG